MKIAERDVRLEGLTALFEPEDTSEVGLDIIFVHGLGGHPVRTWLHTSVENGAPPRDQARPVPARSKSLIRDLASPSENRGNTLKKRQPGHYYPPRSSRRTGRPPRPRSAELGSREAEDSYEEFSRPGGLALGKLPARSKSTTAAPQTFQAGRHNSVNERTSSDTYWPLDLLPESCPSARIFTYGFQTHIVEGKMLPKQPDIYTRGRELLGTIDELRRGGGAGREMVFIAHSSGGIVVKEMLRLASNLLDADDEGLLASIASVIFMGCPLTGTDYGSMVIAMKSMAAATTGVAVDDDVLARMLGGDEDAQLAYLGRDAFEAVRREYNFGVKVYRETNAEQSLEYWAELGLALRRDASTLAANREEDEDIPGDHANMCKFASRRDEGYQLVSSYVTRLVHYQALKSRQLTERETRVQQALADPGALLSGSRIGRPVSRRLSSALPSTERVSTHWLLQHPRLQTWLHRSSREETHKLLWLTGPPGSGVAELLSSLKGHLSQQWSSVSHSSIMITVVADQGESLLESVVFGDSDSKDFGDNDEKQSNGTDGNDLTFSTHETPRETSAIPNTLVCVLRSLLSQLYAHDPRLRNLVRKRTATAGPLHDSDFAVETLLPSIIASKLGDRSSRRERVLSAKHGITRRWSDPTDSTTDLLSGGQTETRRGGHGAPVKVLGDAAIGALFLEDYLCLGLSRRRQQQQHKQRFLDGKRTNDDNNDGDGFKVEIPGIRRVFILVDASAAHGDDYLRDLLWYLSQLVQRSEFSVCVASNTTMPHGADGSRASRTANSISESTLIIQVPDENADDVRLYLDTHLAPDMEERPTIAAKMLARAAGVVLWAEMATAIVNEASEEGVSGEIVLGMLDDIAPPRNGSELLLDDLYAWKLRRLGAAEQAQALAVMQWVMLASEPLRLNELLVALRLTLLARRRGLHQDKGKGKGGGSDNWMWDARETLAVEPAMSLKELREADGDDLGVGKAMDSPTQFWKWLQHLSQGLLRLESQGSSSSGISREPLGLQRVKPVHDSVQRFFLKGTGFQTLLPAPADDARPAKLPSTDRFIDTSYYTLLHVCLLYLSMTELDALGREKPPLNPSPGSALPPEETSKWRAHADIQRRMVMASFPFLRYAVDHLVFHLLCPRGLRFFLPQTALLALLSANRCRLWRRWTHLLGFSIADAAPEILLARAEMGPAGRLLAPVYGARYRLERVLRRVWRIAVEQQRVGSGGGSGSSAYTPWTTTTSPRRSHFRARSDGSEESGAFLLMGGETPLKAGWTVPTSAGQASDVEALKSPRAAAAVDESG